jgi:hypothetical protein
MENLSDVDVLEKMKMQEEAAEARKASYLKLQKSS